MERNGKDPFVKPFLEVHATNTGGTLWHIDVNGRIDDYLTNWTCVHEALHQMVETNAPNAASLACRYYNWMSQATPLLKSILQQLADNGWHVDSICGYMGSASIPTHILRNGKLFELTAVVRPEEPPAENKKESNDIADSLPQILGEAVQTA